MFQYNQQILPCLNFMNYSQGRPAISWPLYKIGQLAKFHHC